MKASKRINVGRNKNNENYSKIKLTAVQFTSMCLTKENSFCERKGVKEAVIIEGKRLKLILGNYIVFILVLAIKPFRNKIEFFSWTTYFF